MTQEIPSQVAEAIGSLKASVDFLAKSVNTINDNVLDVSKNIARIDEKADSAHRRHNVTDREVEDLKSFKNKQLGIVAFISFAGALIGAGVINLFM